MIMLLLMMHMTLLTTMFGFVLFMMSCFMFSHDRPPHFFLQCLDSFSIPFFTRWSRFLSSFSRCFSSLWALLFLGTSFSILRMSLSIISFLVWEFLRRLL